MNTLKFCNWFLLVFSTLSVVNPATAQAEEASMEARCKLEAEELQQFFQDWTTGALDAEKVDMERFASVAADTFILISPSGRKTGRQALIDGMLPTHGKAPADARIWIESFELRWQAEGVAVVTYEHWQEVGGQQRGRLTTTVFRDREDTPNGVEWLHVHETWLPR